MSYNVDTIPQFDKQVKRLIKKFPSLKGDLSKLIISLSENPFQGKSLGNNFYKVRRAISSKGKGKSGGARIITYLKLVQAKIYLAAIQEVKASGIKATFSIAEIICPAISFC